MTIHKKEFRGASEAEDSKVRLSKDKNHSDGSLSLERGGPESDINVAKSQGLIIDNNTTNSSIQIKGRGLVNGNGLTNGNGFFRGKGLVNGNGLTNGNRVFRVRGLVNGNGLTNGNGLVNGNGLTNGNRVFRVRGLINGNGLTNGNGLVNGNGLTNGNGIKKNIHLKKSKRKIMVIRAIMLIIFLMTPYILTNLPLNLNERYGIFIDGNTSDWKDVLGCDDPLDDQNSEPDVNIVNYRLFFEKKTERGWEAKISFYLEVEGYIFGNSKAEEAEDITSYAVHIFIDSDRDPETGYEVNGLGADLVVEIEGHDGVIYTSVLKEFDDTIDHKNWNGYTQRDTVSSAVYKQALEAQIVLDPMSVDKVDVLFQIMDSERNEDFSDMILSNEEGRLMINQQNIAPEVLDIGAKEVKFLRLDLEAYDADIEIVSINLTLKGTAQISDIDGISLFIDDGNDILDIGDEKIATAIFFGNSMVLRPNRPIKVWGGNTSSLFVCVSISSFAMMKRVIGLQIASRKDVVLKSGTVTLHSNPILIYMGAIPENVIIDGAFSDWKGISTHKDLDDLPEKHEDIDIDLCKVAADSEGICFYSMVKGTVMGGTAIPMVPDYKRYTNIPVPKGSDSDGTESENGSKKISSPSREDIPKELLGEDSFYLFIDSDQNISTGYNPNWLPLGADHLVQISGKDGIILNKVSLTFNDDHEKDFALPISDISRILSEKPINDIPLTSSPENPINDVRWVQNANANIEAIAISNKLEVKIARNLWDDKGEVNIFFIATDWNNRAMDHKKLSSTGVGYTRAFATQLVGGIGTSAGDKFGWNVTYAGDVNNDGYDDIIVGAPYNDSADGLKADAGAAYIFFGYLGMSSSDINAANANVTIYGANASDHLGWDVSDAGNFMVNTTYPDIIIGAPGNSSSARGRAYVIDGLYLVKKASADKKIYLNTYNDMYKDAIIELIGGNGGDRFGASVSIAGDVNNDGFDDVIVGAPYNDTSDGSKSNAGAAYIFHGGNKLHDIVTADFNDNVVTIYNTTSSGLWEVKSTLSVGTNPTSVFVGDANNDGYNDILTADGGPETVTLYNGTSSGIWEASSTLTVGTDPMSVFIGDANNDGLNDILTANNVANTVTIYNGTSSGVWDPICTLSVGNQPLSVFVGDANNDGLSDILSADRLDSTVTIYNGTISGTWEDKSTLIVGSIPHSVFIGDANNDGLNDILTADYFANTVTIYNGTSSGAWDPIYTLSVGSAPESVFVGDANNDGLNDILTVDYGSGDTVTIYNGTSDNLWEAKSTLDVGKDPMSVFIGDANNDGLNDIITADRDWDAVSLYNGTNDNFWEPKGNLSVGDQPYSVFVADANNDGMARTQLAKAADVRFYGETAGDNFGFSVSNAGDVNIDGNDDVIVGAPYYDDGGNTDAGRAYIFIGSKTLSGNIDASVADVNMTGGAAGDLFGWSVSNCGNINNAGNDDVIVGAPGYNSNQGRAYIFYGVSYNDILTADADINKVTIYNGTSDNLWEASCTLDVGSNPRSVFVGDANNDGYYDILTADYSDNTVTIYNGTSSGVWEAKCTLSVGNLPFSVFVGDANNDGLNDILTADVGASTVTIYNGTSSGVWEAKGTLSVGSSPHYVFVGDANNDGYNDILTADNNDHTVTIYNGTSSGGWEAKGTLSVGNYPWHVFVGDANNDGLNDILSADEGHDTVTIYNGTGSGGWNEKFTLSVGHWPHFVFVGDANNDGYNDILSADSDDTTITLYNGTSSGVWEPKYTLDGGGGFAGGTESVFIGDANNDGFNDMLASDSTYSIVVIYNGTSDNLWEEKGTLGVGSGPKSVFVGNANNDFMDSTADVTLTGEYTGDKFGYAVRYAGDIDGDGSLDVIIGAPYHTDGGKTQCGASYIYSGGSDIDSTPEFTNYGENANDHFGWSVSLAGNLNDDDSEDAIVGAPDYDDVTNGAECGKTYILTFFFRDQREYRWYDDADSALGAQNTQVSVLGGTNLHLRLGIKVSGQTWSLSGEYLSLERDTDSSFSSPTQVSSSEFWDDVDHTADAILSSAVLTGTDTKETYIESRPNSPSSQENLAISEQGEWDFTIKAPGTVGTWYYRVVITDSSGMKTDNIEVHTTIVVLYVYEPLSDLLDGIGSTDGDRFGWNVSYAGDVNGDGYNDIIVGAPYNDSADGSKADAGATYIFFGYPGISSSDINAANANVTIYGSYPGDLLGWSVSDAGNVSGDGYDDIIIGAPGYGTNNGSAYIFYGRATGSWSGIDDADTDADVNLSGETEGDRFGSSVSGAGDVNNDDYDDIIVGAYGWGSDQGRAYILYGPNLDMTGFGYSYTQNIPEVELAVTASYLDYLTLTVNPVASTNYLIIAASDIGPDGSSPQNGDMTFLRLRIDDDDSKIYHEVVREFENAANDWYQFSAMKYLTFSAGSHDIELEYMTEGDTGTFRNTRIIAIEMDIPDDQYNETETAVTSTTTEVTAAGTTFTPDTEGDYLIIATANIQHSDFKSSTCARMYIDEVIRGETYIEPDDTTYERMNFGVIKNITLDASPHIINLTVESQDPGDTSTMFHAHIVAIRLDTFSEFHYNEAEAQNDGGLGGWETLVTNSYTPITDGDFIVLGTAEWFTDSDGAVNGIRLNNSGYTRQESQVQNQDPTDKHMTFQMDKRILLGTQTDTVDHNIDSATGWSQYARLITLPVGSSYVILTGTSANDKFGFSVSNAGDISNDNLGDVIVGAPGADKAYIILGDDALSDSIAAANADVTLSGSASTDFGWSVANCSDVNADGRDDVIVGAPGYNSDQGRAYIFHGTGYLNDIVTADSSEVKVTIYNGTSDNLWEARSTLSVGLVPFYAFVGDANNDGYNDILTADYDGDTVTIYNGTSDGLWDPKYTLSVGNGPISVYVGDANNDGYNDILTADTGSGANAVTIYNGTSSGLWEAKCTLDVGTAPKMVFVGDANNDGYNDILTADSAMDYVSIFNGTSSGFWEARDTLSVGDNPNAVFVGDANNDGLNDILTADRDDNTVTIYNGTSNNIWDPKYTLSVGPGPKSVFVGDANNDGYNDILTADYSGSSVTIYNGTSDNLWEAKYRLSNAGGLVECVFVGDANNDGLNDILIADNGAHEVVIFNGTSDNLWEAKSALDVGNGPLSVFVANVNNDIMDNTADVTFTGQDMGDKFGYSVSYAGDIDGDGDPDVIVGAPYHTHGAKTECGAIYVYCGGPDIDSTANYTNYGEYAYDHFGWSVSYAGDINDDDYNDTLSSAPHYDDGSNTDAGKVYCHTMYFIPEFSEIVMPVITMLIIFAVWKRKNHKKKEKAPQNKRSKCHGGTTTCEGCANEKR